VLVEEEAAAALFKEFLPYGRQQSPSLERWKAGGTTASAARCGPWIAGARRRRPAAGGGGGARK
jgi:hypothetical protein